MNVLARSLSRLPRLHHEPPNYPLVLVARDCLASRTRVVQVRVRISDKPNTWDVYCNTYGRTYSSTFTYQPWCTHVRTYVLLAFKTSAPRSLARSLVDAGSVRACVRVCVCVRAYVRTCSAYMRVRVPCARHCSKGHCHAVYHTRVYTRSRAVFNARRSSVHIRVLRALE